MNTDLVGMTRSLIDKDGTPSDRWLSEVRSIVKDPNVVKQFFYDRDIKRKVSF